MASVFCRKLRFFFFIFSVLSTAAFSVQDAQSQRFLPVENSPAPLCSISMGGKSGGYTYYIGELPPSKPVGVRPLRLLTTFASTSPKGRGKSTAGIFLVSPNTLATGFKSWLSLRGKTSPAPGEDVTVGDKRGNLSPQATEGVSFPVKMDYRSVRRRSGSPK